MPRRAAGGGGRGLVMLVDALLVDGDHGVPSAERSGRPPGVASSGRLTDGETRPDVAPHPQPPDQGEDDHQLEPAPPPCTAPTTHHRRHEQARGEADFLRDTLRRQPRQRKSRQD